MRISIPLILTNPTHPILSTFFPPSLLVLPSPSPSPSSPFQCIDSTFVASLYAYHMPSTAIKAFAASFGGYRYCRP
jgi:hypothetical protein